MSKTIKINTEFFKLTSPKKTRKSFQINSSLKQEMMAKMKQLKKEHKQKAIKLIHESSPIPVPIPLPMPVQPTPAPIPSFPTTSTPIIEESKPIVDIDDCIEYLSKPAPPQPLQKQYEIDNFPYGCLRNGIKPTYKKYKLSQSPSTSLPDEILPSTSKKDEESELAIFSTSKKKKMTLGKSKIFRKISVLLKNNDTRNKIKHAVGILQQKSIFDAKKLLREKNILKIGSLAPDALTKVMYESVMLTGDVVNINKSALIHNFINDKENVN